MGIFSGNIPILNVGGTNLSTFTSGAFGNLADVGLGFALSQTGGANVAKYLGLSPTGNSNFLGSILSPGLITTGVGGLSQIVTNSIINSQSLGIFGPIAGGIAQTIISNLGNDLINSLFAPKAASGPSIAFPGAGGEGEGEAYYGGATYPGNRAYTLGEGGADVVFSITSAMASVRKEQKEIALQNAAIEVGKTAAGPNGPLPLGDTAASAAAAASVNPTASATPTASAPIVPPTAPGMGTTTTTTTAGSANGAGTGSIPPENSSRAGTPSYLNAVGASVAATNSGTPGAAPATGTANVGTGTPLASDVGAAALGGAATTGDVTAGLGDPAVATAIGATAGQPLPTAPEEPPEDPGVVWKFICAPEEVSWETTMQTDRIQIFGANQAPVVSGVKGMRDLTLNNAVVEGFNRGKTVEDKIIMLESMLDMTLDTQKKYVQVPVYRVSANSKIYGQGLTDRGFFIIKSIKVQEKIRDLNGKTTRAMVDISLTQVPPYQVDSGRDIASSFLASQQAPFHQIGENLKNQSLTNVKNQASQGTGTSSRAGSGGSGSQPSAAPNPPAGRGGVTQITPGSQGPLGTHLP